LQTQTERERKKEGKKTMLNFIYTTATHRQRKKEEEE
jgi:hypothetical protein